MPSGKQVIWGLVFGIAGAILYDKVIKETLKL